jgi:hypothetical protein
MEVQRFGRENKRQGKEDHASGEVQKELLLTACHRVKLGFLPDFGVW